MQLRAMRRDRAARLGADLFLHERAFEDCLERLALSAAASIRSADRLPRSGWRGSSRLVGRRRCVDPRTAVRRSRRRAPIDRGCMAAASRPPTTSCLALGTLDTVNDLPRALLAIRCRAPSRIRCLLGAMSGGDTLPRLRAAMRAADQRWAPPRPTFTRASSRRRLSSAARRRRLRDAGRRRRPGARSATASLGRLVARPARRWARPISDLRARRRRFAARALPRRSNSRRRGDGERTTETFELLHFAAWTPAARRMDEARVKHAAPHQLLTRCT